MAAELIPLVLVPRYTTIAGPDTVDLSTSPVDVSAYSMAYVTVWRGHIVGTPAPTEPEPPPPLPLGFAIAFEESTDQVTWQMCSGGPPADVGMDPGENVQVALELTLTRRWLRARLHVYAADNVVTCWAAGFLERRLK